MDFNTNEEGLRDTVFNTINLLTEIESKNGSQGVISDSNFEQKQRATRQEENAQLSSQFVSGIKEKLLDPSKIEQLQQGKGSEIDRLKFNMHKNLEQLKVVIDAQNSDIAELKSFISDLKQEIVQLKNRPAQQPHIQQLQQQQFQQSVVEQEVMQEAPVQQGFQQSQNQVFGQQISQTVSSSPVQANPRVGNYNSSDVSIEKYFYCGK